MVTYTKSKKSKVFNKYGGKCFYCKKDKPTTIDHYIPKSKGGNNSLENLVPSCGKCNITKGNFVPTIDKETAWNSDLKPWELEVKKIWNIGRNFKPSFSSRFRRANPYKG